MMWRENWQNRLINSEIIAYVQYYLVQMESISWENTAVLRWKSRRSFIKKVNKHDNDATKKIERGEKCQMERERGYNRTSARASILLFFLLESLPNLIIFL